MKRSISWYVDTSNGTRSSPAPISEWSACRTPIIIIRHTGSRNCQQHVHCHHIRHNNTRCERLSGYLCLTCICMRKLTDALPSFLAPSHHEQSQQHDKACAHSLHTRRQWVFSHAEYARATWVRTPSVPGRMAVDHSGRNGDVRVHRRRRRA